MDLNTRQRVIVWHSNNIEIPKIVGRPEAENIMTTNKTIYLLLKKYKSTGSVHDLPWGSRKKLYVQHYCFIDEALSQNDKITCTQLHKQLRNRFPNIIVSLSIVKRAKEDLGWVSSTPHYCQLKREANKPKQVEWCHKCFDENERFTNVIWTDECSVQLDPHRKQVYRRWGISMCV